MRQVLVKVCYKVEVRDPKNHLVEVTISVKKWADKMEFFLPSWSPGSYLMREYSKNIRSFCAKQCNGEILFHHQLEKGVFQVDYSRSQLNKPLEEFSIHYEIYCHELTVRTSHVDESHAFLHGPSYLMGVVGREVVEPEISFHFPPLWSKVATGLEDISPSRGEFLYRAKDYDQLVDTPVEIGCHDSDGFMVGGKPHHLNFYGLQYPHDKDLKKDMKKIVETVSEAWGEIPYDQYVFITHFVPGIYGGLEHHNSTALHFDGTQMEHREKYLLWLELVAHEYFHTWNVKRIRPEGLGPFDYLKENYTRMHWLTEGLTSFMDGLFVLRSGLMSLTEYLEKLTRELNALDATPGRKFHSLEDSSFNAWIKLYRPDENSKNSSVSYYLKGALVFLALQCMLGERGKDLVSLMASLWKRYKENPAQGLQAEEVYSFIEELAGSEVREKFETYVSTTQEVDFASHLKSVGIGIEWTEAKGRAYLGVEPRFEGERVFVDKVILDSPAYRGGVNAGDEILFVNGCRFLRSSWENFSQTARVGALHDMVLSRLGRLWTGKVICEETPRAIKSLKVDDRELAQRVFEGVHGK